MQINFRGRVWRCEMSTQQEPDSGESWDLTPLTPKFQKNEHGQYVTAIEAALSDEQIRNIALSGNFGVGKSSILQEIALRKKKRVVELSLSTLAPIEASKLDESVPIQATTPTNRIQQEIVKQLLYRVDPRKTPASRFRRIERFQWWREIWSSALLGLAITIIFLLSGWTTKLANTFSFLGNMDVWLHLVILGMATGMALLVRWRFFGKLHIKQLSAGSATVSLDETSVSYFDQYLDEIIYFFEVSKRDIVIFEDIDRFNDSHIFETLRALNTLLNASPQIKKRFASSTPLRTASLIVSAWYRKAASLSLTWSRWMIRHKLKLYVPTVLSSSTLSSRWFPSSRTGVLAIWRYSYLTASSPK